MASWTLVEGRMADGLPMRVYLAEHEGKLWGATLGDDEHPRDEDEFVAGLGKSMGWQRCERCRLSSRLSQAAGEIEEYLAGRRLEFSSPLPLRGTPFQVRVWEELLRIPFGVTRSYGDLASSIGHPTAFRAVGAANGRNRLPLFVPCHRVIAAGGKLCGFTGGIGLKKRLLAHEAAVLGPFALAQTA